VCVSLSTSTQCRGLSYEGNCLLLPHLWIVLLLLNCMISIHVHSSIFLNLKMAKLSSSQLQWFIILFHQTLGYCHPLVLLNTVSKLTLFHSRLAMFHCSPPRCTSTSYSSLLEFVRSINIVIVIIINAVSLLHVIWALLWHLFKVRM